MKIKSQYEFNKIAQQDLWNLESAMQYIVQPSDTIELDADLIRDEVIRCIQLGVLAAENIYSEHVAPSIEPEDFIEWAVSNKLGGEFAKKWFGEKHPASKLDSELSSFELKAKSDAEQDSIASDIFKDTELSTKSYSTWLAFFRYVHKEQFKGNTGRMTQVLEQHSQEHIEDDFQSFIPKKSWINMQVKAYQDKWGADEG